ncbi:MAG TPA: hypothetical protein VMX15_03440 [Candidatus Heimdallarchaeota archaeon]|nr:hypothetical protein [Candidatus Heimdallarchaeota archaeon]
MAIRQPMQTRQQAEAGMMMPAEQQNTSIVPVTGDEQNPTAPSGIQSMPDAPLHQRIMNEEGLEEFLLTRLKRRRDYAVRSIEHRYEEWDRVREHMNMYVNLNRKARKGDRTSFSTDVEMPFQRSIVVPATYATLHVLLAQIMSIYSSRKPMFQVAGVGPEDRIKAKLMEVLLDYDAKKTGSYGIMYSAFLDALTTGMGVVYDCWDVEKGNQFKYTPLEVPGVPPELLVAQLGPLAYTPIKEWTVKDEHNRWRVIDPYRVRKDPRVPLSRLQEGEFFGHQFDASYNYFAKRAMPDGPYFNIEALKELKVNRTQIRWDKNFDGADQSTNIDSGFRMHEGYGDFYTSEHMVVDLIPSDWKVGPGQNPEKFVFTWTEDQKIIRAHDLMNWHGAFPYSGMETDPDIHAANSPGQGELIEGLQRVVSWLYNSWIENITAVMNNRWVYSPRFINQVDLDYGGPGENIRMKNEAVEMMMSGEISSIQQFLYQMPMQDVTGPTHVPALEKTYSFIQLLTGANDPLSGIPTPTERSATEIQTISAKATDRIAIMTKLMDEQGIQPLIKRSMYNRQQLTRIERYYRIVGEFQRKLGMDNIFVGLMDIQGDFDYEAITGIVPEDPARAATTWVNLMQGAGQIPQLQQPGPDGTMLDFREMFKTIAEKMGVTDIDRYMMQVEVQPDEQVQQQAQQGNVVPINGQGQQQVG